MQSDTKTLEKYQGKDVRQYSLTNNNGVSITTMTLGSTFTGIYVPTKDGKKKNILLSFTSPAKYLDNPFYLCQAIGRTAGRITKGTFTLMGKEYHVDPNEGTTTLHGGPHGFNSRIWDGRIEDNKIIYNTNITSASDSFPGNMKAQVEYSLSEDDEVTVKFTASSDADTLFNPTIHAYFNLSDSQNTLGLNLKINADKHLEFNMPEKTPDGKMPEVNGTPYDFRNGQKLGDAIKAVENQTGNPFDDIFVINDHTPEQPIATLSDPQSGRSVNILSSRNALVVFTPKGWTKDTDFPDFAGVALEAQSLPDAQNHKGFGSHVLPANQKQSYEIKYQINY